MIGRERPRPVRIVLSTAVADRLQDIAETIVDTDTDEGKFLAELAQSIRDAA